MERLKSTTRTVSTKAAASVKQAVSAESRAKAVAKTKEMAVAAQAKYVEVDAAVDSKLVSLVSSSRAQLLAVSFTVLLIVGPGIGLNAVGGITLADSGADVLFVTRVVEYSFAIVGGLLAGPLSNMLGPRLLLCAAAVAQLCVLGSQLFLWTKEDNRGSLTSNGVQFAIFSAAVAAATRALLFAAAAPAVLAYVSESRKAVALASFASIYGLSFIAAQATNVALTWAKDSFGILPTYTYWIALPLPLVGWALSLLVLRPWQVVHKGKSVMTGAKPTVRGELTQAKLLFSNKGLWTLAACVALMSYYNGTTIAFTPVSLTDTITSSARTTSLIKLVYQVAYLLGVWIISLSLLDNIDHPRAKRARMTSAMLIVALMVVLVGTYIKAVTIYGAYSVYGLFDGFTHAFFVWLVGSFSNSPIKQSRYVGFLYAIYYLVNATKYAVTENVSVVLTYDKFISIGLVVIALIVMGAFNFHFVGDTCEEEDEHEVAFKSNIISGDSPIQLEEAAAKKGDFRKGDEHKGRNNEGGKKVVFADA
ncbi:UNVERIFIED_CONTAM: hypothetical protein HDU68_008886 [Siphonaria sp. JEL0065]|nr:hypothetical protein HDU68_008886 [Siphonaria sp. JEL0065]